MAAGEAAAAPGQRPRDELGPDDCPVCMGKFADAGRTTTCRCGYKICGACADNLSECPGSRCAWLAARAIDRGPPPDQTAEDEEIARQLALQDGQTLPPVDDAHGAEPSPAPAPTAASPRQPVNDARMRAQQRPPRGMRASATDGRRNNRGNVHSGPQRRTDQYGRGVCRICNGQRAHLLTKKQETRGELACWKEAGNSERTFPYPTRPMLLKWRRQEEEGEGDIDSEDSPSV